MFVCSSACERLADSIPLQISQVLFTGKKHVILQQIQLMKENIIVRMNPYECLFQLLKHLILVYYNYKSDYLISNIYRGEYKCAQVAQVSDTGEQKSKIKSLPLSNL